MRAKALTVLISLVVLVGLVLGGVVLSGPAKPKVFDQPRQHVPVHPGETDHAAFFPDPLPDGPSVTRACLSCHPGAAQEVMQTSHWTWSGDRAQHSGTGQVIPVGKRNVQNNFCIAIAANWPRCTSCHVGYGWRDDGFLEQAGPEQVDCLICHDGSGTYEKEPTGAGLPREGVDLRAAAQSVGRTTRANCGVCHFKGGGGDGVKHGDLDETMYFPPERVDVHMGKHDLRCADCHRTEKHHVKGRLLPEEIDPDSRVTCVDCHAGEPHAQDRLNGHVKTVACQTCHIPLFAVETGTKMWWDWSKAGRKGDPAQIARELSEEIRDKPAGYPRKIVDLAKAALQDPGDYHAHYNKKKGFFLIAARQVPEYRWYNRATKRYLPGERSDIEGVLDINRPQGDARDPRAKIWPFKIHRGRQPFDGEHRHLLSPHVFGKGGYWAEFDWEKALREGAEASGVPYSGQLEWKTTRMYWPQNHMVQVKESSLQCVDCHREGGRMDWEALGYPGDPAFQGDRRQMDVLREEKR
jgi:octaheme c-type cytochrome (tetrathionate reductase family)